MYPSLIPATSKPLQGAREVPICDRWTQRRNRAAQSPDSISVAGGRDDSAVVPEAVEDRRRNGGVFARRVHLRDHSHPRCAVHAAAGTARATLTLALAAFGLINIIDSLGAPWSSFGTTLLLVLSARVLFAAAQRSPDKRFAWLLSASVAAGLSIADTYNLITSTPPARAAVVAVCIASLLLIARGITRQRRWSRPTHEAATHGVLEHADVDRQAAVASKQVYESGSTWRAA
jgi:hypothetical protein